MKTYKLILTEWERAVFERWLGRPIKEGDKILGAEVVFAQPCEEAAEKE